AVALVLLAVGRSLVRGGHARRHVRGAADVVVAGAERAVGVLARALRRGVARHAGAGRAAEAAAVLAARGVHRRGGARRRPVRAARGVDRRVGDAGDAVGAGLHGAGVPVVRREVGVIRGGAHVARAVAGVGVAVVRGLGRARGAGGGEGEAAHAHRAAALLAL